VNAIGMKVGMKPGDIVLAVDGKEVGSLSDFYRQIWAIGNAGMQIPLTILQGNKIRDVKLPAHRAGLPGKEGSIFRCAP
jgi:S1-C subfamily serine protease